MLLEVGEWIRVGLRLASRRNSLRAEIRGLSTQHVGEHVEQRAGHCISLLIASIKIGIRGRLGRSLRLDRLFFRHHFYKVSIAGNATKRVCLYVYK